MEVPAPFIKVQKKKKILKGKLRLLLSDIKTYYKGYYNKINMIDKSIGGTEWRLLRYPSINKILIFDKVIFELY